MTIQKRNCNDAGRPRYSSGYASMFHSYGMITENQIYRDFPDRVKSCYQFINVLANFVSENSGAIKKSVDGIKESMDMKNYSVAFQLDTTKFERMEFKGFEVDKNQISPVSGLPRFGYDTSKPYTERIKYFNFYAQTETVEVPEFYILPQSYRAIIERLNLVGIQYSRLQNDTLINVAVDYIDEFSMRQNLIMVIIIMIRQAPGARNRRFNIMRAIW